MVKKKDEPGVNKMYYYLAFGLKVCSELQCPYRSIEPTKEIDIKIEGGNVPDYLPNNDPHACYQRFQDKILIQDPLTGKFLVQNGTHIFFDLPSNINVKTSLLPSYVFAALLQQRSYFVLHANAVVKDDKAILLMGSSGKGKSTLTYLLIELGCQLITDDISVIDFSAREISVLPGSAYLKFTPDNIERFDIKDEMQPAGFGSTKSCLKTSKSALHPARVSGICLLDIAETISPYTTKRIKGLEGIKPLLHNIFFADFSTEGRYATNYFKECVEIMNQVPLWYLTRSNKFFSGYQIAEFLYNQFFINDRSIQ